MYTHIYFGFFFKYSPTGSQTALDNRDAQPPVSRYPTGYPTKCFIDPSDLDMQCRFMSP